MKFLARLKRNILLIIIKLSKDEVNYHRPVSSDTSMSFMYRNFYHYARNVNGASESFVKTINQQNSSEFIGVSFLKIESHDRDANLS